MRLPSLIILLFALALPVNAQTLLGVARGGTASSTLTGILVGNGINSLQTLTVGSNLTLTGTTLSASGGISTALTKGYFIVGDDLGVAQATSTIFISSTGRVGVGTTNPSSLFHIYGTSPVLTIQGATSNGEALELVDNGGTRVGRFGNGGNLGGAFNSNDVVLRSDTGGGTQRLNLYSMNTLRFFTGANDTARMTIDTAGAVGIGITAPTAKLHVVQPDNTTTGLLIKAASNAPTNNLLEIQRFSDTAIGFRVGYEANTGVMNMFLNGNAAFGGTAVSTSALLTVGANLTDPSSSQQAIYSSRTLSLTANNAQEITGAYFNISTAANAFNQTGNLQGGFFQVQNSLTGTAANVIGGGFLAYNTGAGTITNAVGGNFAIQNLNASGVITSAYAVKVPDFGLNVGTITNTYGVYVGDITLGTQTNTPYSFYAADAGTYNYFAGNVGIGTTTPDNLLSINKPSSVASQEFVNLLVNGKEIMTLGEDIVGDYGGAFILKDGLGGSSNVALRYNAGYPQFTTTQQVFSFVGNGFTTRFTNSYIDFAMGAVINLTLLAGGNVGIATSTPAVLLDIFSTGTSTMRLDSNSATKGGCIILKDTDGAGYTQVVAANGVLTASINSTGTTCN